MKLVRDNIPEIIIKNGQTPVITIADSKEYWKLLCLKLKEEVDEFLESNETEAVYWIPTS